MIIKVKLLLGVLRFALLLPFYFCSEEKEKLDADIDRWIKELHIKLKSKIWQLTYLLWFDKSFRNIFYFRCPSVLNVLRRILCKPDATLHFASFVDGKLNNIPGGGVFLIHPYSTIIPAKSIGYGCIFRQLTTIGTKGTNKPLAVPTIGNNVDFGANVTCIGDIKIGNNAVIGAGSVVVKDVPDNAIVVGNPARVIKFRSKPPIKTE